MQLRKRIIMYDLSSLYKQIKIWLMNMWDIYATQKYIVIMTRSLDRKSIEFEF